MDLRKVLTVFLLLIFALVLTPTVASSVFMSKYMSAATEPHTVDPSASNVTTVNYGNVLNSTTYITVIANGTITIGSTGSMNYTVTAHNQFTWEGLDSAKIYEMVISYSYLNPDATVRAMVDLTPLFWILIIVSIAAVALSVELKDIGG